MKKHTLFALIVLTCSSINTAFGFPFTLQFNSKVEPSGVLPSGVATNQDFSIDLVVDNGGSVLQNQTWDESDVISISIRTASASYFSPTIPRNAFHDALSGDSGTITTDSNGIINAITANWAVDMISGTFLDSNAQRIERFYIKNSNDIWFSTNSHFGNLNEPGAINPARWTIEQGFIPQTTYAGTIQNAPVFHRVHNLSCSSLSSVTGADATPYHVQGFTVDTAGSYTLSTAHNRYDGHITLYQKSFSPANALTNCIAVSDDAASFFTSKIDNAILQANETYYLVTTGYDNFRFGNFKSAIYGPGKVTLGAAGDCNSDHIINVQDAVCTINKALIP